MIEKILDKYYTKKLQQEIKKYMMIWFDLDMRFVEYKNKFQLHIKMEEYNDEQYKEILTFYKKESFIHLCMWEEVEKAINERVNKYFKYIKEIK